MSVPLDLAAAVEQRSLREALGHAHSARVLAALAEHAGWSRTPPQPPAEDPLTLARIARLVLVPGYLQDLGVINGILAQMPEHEQRFLGQLARAHHAATRTEEVEAARGRLLRALDETARACRAASRDAYAHAETAYRLNAAHTAGAQAFTSTASQLYQAGRILHSPSTHEDKPTTMILRISGLPVEARAGMPPGSLTLTPLTDPAASPSTSDRGLADLMALHIPPTGEPETAAHVEEHFHRVAGDLERLHLRELTDRETLDQINGAVQRMHQILRSHQPLDSSTEAWARTAFDEHCAQLTTLLKAPLESPGTEPADRYSLGQTVAALSRRAQESYRAYRDAPMSSGLYEPMIQDVIAHLKASVDLVIATTGRARPQPAPAATFDAAATLQPPTSSIPGLQP